MTVKLETMEQYHILRHLNQHGINPAEIEIVDTYTLRVTLDDGNVVLFTHNSDGTVSAHEQDPVC